MPAIPAQTTGTFASKRTGIISGLLAGVFSNATYDGLKHASSGIGMPFLPAALEPIFKSTFLLFLFLFAILVLVVWNWIKNTPLSFLQYGSVAVMGLVGFVLVVVVAPNLEVMAGDRIVKPGVQAQAVRLSNLAQQEGLKNDGFLVSRLTVNIVILGSDAIIEHEVQASVKVGKTVEPLRFLHASDGARIDLNNLEQYLEFEVMKNGVPTDFAPTCVGEVRVAKTGESVMVVTVQNFPKPDSSGPFSFRRRMYWPGAMIRGSGDIVIMDTSQYDLSASTLTVNFFSTIALADESGDATALSALRRNADESADEPLILFYPKILSEKHGVEAVHDKTFTALSTLDRLETKYEAKFVYAASMEIQKSDIGPEGSVAIRYFVKNPPFWRPHR